VLTKYQIEESKKATATYEFLFLRPTQPINWNIGRRFETFTTIEFPKEQSLKEKHVWFVASEKLDIKFYKKTVNCIKDLNGQK